MQAQTTLTTFTLITMVLGTGLSAWAVRFVKTTLKYGGFGVFDYFAITGFTINVIVVMWLVGYVIVY